MAITAKAPQKDVSIEEATIVEPKKTKKSKSEAKAVEMSWKGVAALRKEYAELKMNLLVGKEKNTSQLRKLRAQIARTLTHLNNQN